MGLDRRLRDDEFGRYLGVEKPPRDEGEHLGLALGAAAEPAAAGRGPTSTNVFWKVRRFHAAPKAQARGTVQVQG